MGAAAAPARPTRLGEDLAEIERVLADLARLHAGAGYSPVQPPHLFPAELLLDLYGEDIRGRAFLFPGGGGDEEICLRPDFTVPLAVSHGARGWERPAKYAYQGPVFRRQEAGSSRPAEYLQAGIENVGAADPAAAEAGVLSLTLAALEGIGVEGAAIVTGDLGIVFALLEALEMPEHRRARLRRHVWRPARFHRMVEEAVAGPPPRSARREALIAAAGAPDAGARIAVLAEEAGEILGAREVDEIVQRARALARAAEEPPMPVEQARLIEAVLGLEGPSGEALTALRRLAGEADVNIACALDSFERRLDAFNRAGLDGEALPFDASFGRSLEYYDGFVFEITAEDRPGVPPLAGGGRYDSLLRRLGAARAIPAVGAMVRPEAAIAARGGTA